MQSTNGEKTTETATATKELKHMEKLEKEMSAFYRAVGFFNSTVMGKVHADPTRARKFTELLIQFCVVHDEQCGAHHVYDHGNDVCVRLGPLEQGE